ncbi:IST1 homolog isoform X1 [Ischnura elegans]|uniref:IST1 homolog isoform X1 n=1 Tax=Ischnura elegans TaxID=197161 RepID=UPI001ED88885|nr:IST1 homolog isoform X1 [Ischnura elegans]
MFAGGPNYAKLKTNLRLAINRLRLLEKKKTELAQKARKEIADYIAAGKYERAKIRVEHIIREDYMVEAMEVVEMYCDLLLARYGLIQQMKVLDDGLAEPISSLIWVAPRMQTDVAELHVIADQLSAKYGKQYAQACREEGVSTISEKLKHKMSVQSPPKLLVEKYMIEIAKNYNVEYEPDPQVMKDDQSLGVDALLIDIGENNKNNLGGMGAGAPHPFGFVGYPQPPAMPQPSSDFKPDANFKPFSYPNPAKPEQPFHVPPPLPMQGPSAPSPNPSMGFNIPPSEDNMATTFDTSPGAKALNTNNMDESPPPPYQYFPPDLKNGNKQSDNKPKPAPRGKLSPQNELVLPELPSVPTDSFPPLDDSDPAPNDEIDFDDLTRRFEDLKKKK